VRPQPLVGLRLLATHRLEDLDRIDGFAALHW
jgi:hypothetical protein